MTIQMSKRIKIFKYGISILLVFWGLFIFYQNLFLVGGRIPFITLFTVIAIMLEINKKKQADIFFFISASLWILFNAESIGFLIFFPGQYFIKTGFFLTIPIILSIGLIFLIKSKIKYFNTNYKKSFLILFLLFIGVISYVYKPYTKEVNAIYSLSTYKKYKVNFSIATSYSFDVVLSSENLKKLVEKNAMDISSGFYCPETKIRVISCFGKIVSAKILSFRNTEIDKKFVLKNPIKIPIDKIRGKLSILKPIFLNLWD